MTLKEFGEGMAVYKSCGGSDLDEFTLSAWYSMLKGISKESWQRAVLEICESEKNLALINFVAEVKERVRRYSDKKQLGAWKVDRDKHLQEPQVDQGEVKKFIKEFCGGIKPVDSSAKPNRSGES